MLITKELNTDNYDQTISLLESCLANGYLISAYNNPSITFSLLSQDNKSNPLFEIES